ncbi:MAG: DUF2892 domain-containing protein [Methanosarcinales archaeon]|nr:DUF2892 domain-containing protein [Methanosarcinales archaeon]
MIWMMILKHLIGIPELKTIASVRALSKLEPNIGKKDRSIRFVIGAAALVCLVLFVKRGFIARYLLGLAALAGLTTAYLKFSPVYALIGENTRKKKKKNK